MSHMTDTKTQIADKVRGLMAEKRSSQSDIALVLRLSRNSVNRRFTGKAPWLAHELQALAEHWGVPVSRFYPEVVAA